MKDTSFFTHPLMVMDGRMADSGTQTCATSREAAHDTAWCVEGADRVRVPISRVQRSMVGTGDNSAALVVARIFGHDEPPWARAAFLARASRASHDLGTKGSALGLSLGGHDVLVGDVLVGVVLGGGGAECVNIFIA